MKSKIIIVVFLISILQVGLAQKVVIKVNPLTCITCLGGIGNILNNAKQEITLIFPEKINREDAPDLIQKLLNIDPNKTNYIISDSIYQSLSRTMDSELFAYGSNGTETLYFQLSNLTKNNNCFIYSSDSITENCNSKYLFVKQFTFLDSLSYFTDSRLGFLQIIDFLHQKCLSAISFDSISLTALYDSLEIDTSFLNRFNRNIEISKQFNRESVIVNSIFTFNNDIFSLIFVPLVKVNDAGTLLFSGISIIAQWNFNRIKRIYKISTETFTNLSLTEGFAYQLNDVLMLPLLNKSHDSLFLGSFEPIEGLFKLTDVRYLQKTKTIDGVLELPFYTNFFLFSNKNQTVFSLNENKITDFYGLLSGAFNNSKIFIQDIKQQDKQLHFIYSINSVYYYSCWEIKDNGNYQLQQNQFLQIDNNIKSRIVFQENLDLIYITNDNSIKLLKKRPLNLATFCKVEE